MKCPRCGSKMLDSPPWERYRGTMKYFLCYDCAHRVIVKCKWMTEASIGSPLNWKWEIAKYDWCTKMECFCNPSSSPEGYIFCPQIREWQEKGCDWVKAFNHEFEKKLKAKQKAHLEKCRRVYDKSMERK